MKRLFTIIAATTLLASCGNQLPKEYSESKSLPSIYPDYVGVTIPVNIAPLTFEMDTPAEEMAVRFSAGDEEMICNGNKVQPDIDDWRQLTKAAQGKAVKVEVYTRSQGQWTRFKPFDIYVSTDSIDPYISYRLIAPSYVSYEDLTINQRCLENYDESVVYDNMLCSDGPAGQCINCHNYQQYNPDRMQFHARENLGGTLVAYDGKMRKVNMKNDSTLSAGVYPTWHPWLKLIVYSTNQTHQTFHTMKKNKIEVFDTQSDLIAYDVEKNEATNIESGPDEMEVFPFWAPDGKTLYFCSAHFEYKDTIDQGLEFIGRAEECKYNIYKKSFDPETLQFGPRELVFDATAIDKSATFPRVSPDGRFLLFTLAEYGVFHIWHHDADLWMLDLRAPSNLPQQEKAPSNLPQLGEASEADNTQPTSPCRGQQEGAYPLTELNSPDTESYHSWSSNGRWVVFSSRRNDGNYTRPFIAHIDKDGHSGKPFELPCTAPDYHRQFMRCYNIPEFMKGPVTIQPQEFADVLKRDAEPVKYVQKLSK